MDVGITDAAGEDLPPEKQKDLRELLEKYKMTFNNLPGHKITGTLLTQAVVHP